MIEIIIAAAVMAVINRFRGGWPKKPSWMPGHARLWASLAVFLAGWLPFGPATSLALALAFLGGSAPGWHNYMNCGDDPAGSNGPNVWWIDSLLFRLYGPYYVPSGRHVDPIFSAAGFAKPSPNGAARPARWRRKVSCTGMALRGLLYLPFLLVVPFFYGSWPAALPALSVLLFAPAYGLSRFIWHKTRFDIKYRDDSLTIAEPLVGAIFGAVLAAQWLIVGGGA